MTIQRRFIFILICMQCMMPGIVQHTLFAENFRSANSIDLENRRIFDMRFQKPDSCIALARSNLNAAEKIGHSKGMAQACSNLALCFGATRTDSAEKYFKKSIHFRKNWAIPSELGKGYNNYSQFLCAQKRYDECIQQTDSALLYLHPTLDKKHLAKNYQLKAQSHLELGNFGQAKKWLDLALALTPKEEKPKRYAALMQVAGSCAVRTFEYEQAIFNFKEAWNYHSSKNSRDKMANAANNLGVAFILYEKPDSAIFWLRKSINLRSEENQERKAETLKNIGDCFYHKSQTDSAIHYFEAAMAMSVNERTKSAIYKNLADCYTDLGMPEDALAMIDMSLKLAPKLSNQAYFEKTLKTKALLEAGNNNFQTAYNDLSSSLDHTFKYYSEVNYVNDLEINKLDLNYKVQQKDLELQIQKEKREFWLATGGLIFTLMFSGFGLISLRQRQKNKLQEAEFNAERAKNELREKAREGIIDAEKAERERIGQQLHDLLGTSLTLLRLQFEGLEEYLQEAPLPIQEKFKSSYDLLKRTGSEVREISHKMAAPYLRELGLSAAVEDLCEKIRNSTGIEVDFHAHGMEKRLPPSFEGVLYQWTRELMNNSLKHAQASEISVQLNRFEEDENTLVNIIIEDNGKGFPVQNLENGKKTGLSGLRERVQEMNGTLEIDSSPQRGTSISIDISI